jgi:hypothetical protein
VEPKFPRIVGIIHRGPLRIDHVATVFLPTAGLALVDLVQAPLVYSPGTVRADDACAPHAAGKSESLDTAGAFAFLLPSLFVRLTL